MMYSKAALRCSGVIERSLITSFVFCSTSSSLPKATVLRMAPHLSGSAKAAAAASSLAFMSCFARYLGVRYPVVLIAEKKPPIRATPKKVSMLLSRLKTPVCSLVSSVWSPTNKALSTLPATSSAYSPIVPCHCVRLPKSLMSLATSEPLTADIKSFTLPKPILSSPLDAPFPT